MNILSPTLPDYVVRISQNDAISAVLFWESRGDGLDPEREARLEVTLRQLSGIDLAIQYMAVTLMPAEVGLRLIDRPEDVMRLTASGLPQVFKREIYRYCFLCGNLISSRSKTGLIKSAYDHAETHSDFFEWAPEYHIHDTFIDIVTASMADHMFMESTYDRSSGHTTARRIADISDDTQLALIIASTGGGPKCPQARR